MICYMKIFSTLLCLLFLHQNASAICPPGKMFNHNKKHCEACPPNFFSDRTSAYCDNCSECKKGNREVKSCTPTSDAVCECTGGFTRNENTILASSCYCKKGFGIDGEGRCTECTKGFYTDKDDSSCKTWRECKSGIKTQGTSTSDVVCKNASEVIITESPKNLTPLYKTTTTFSTTTTSVSSNSSTNNDIFYSLWLIMACAILLLGGLLYHKCKVTHCIDNHKKVDVRKESVCRKPVEESGEKCLSLLV